MEDFKKEINNTQNIDNFCQKKKIKSFSDSNHEDLILLRYTRSISDLDDPITRKCRGTIINKNSLEPVFFGLPSRLDYDKFKLSNNFNETIITQLVDGTMVNLFYHDSWILSTKSRINANDSYFNNDKSFGELFKETTSIDYDQLNKDVCYSFVFVHNENIIVKKYETNKAYLVFARNIKTGDVVTDQIHINNIGDNIVGLKRINDFHSYQELENYLVNQEFNTVGYMIHNNNGERTKIYVPEFEKIKSYQGNHPNYTYRLLKLTKDKKVNDFLNYYPDQVQLLIELNIILDEICKYIVNLYHNSRKKYIEFPEYLAKHIYSLHKIYISNKENGVKKPNINLNKVYEYFNNLDLNNQYYLVKSWKMDDN